MLLDFESAGQYTNRFRQVSGSGTAAQTDPTAGEPDNDCVQTSSSGVVAIYDTTPADGPATRDTFAPPLTVTARLRFGTANNSFGVYFVNPTNESQAYLALFNVDYAGGGADQIRFAANGNPLTAGAGTLVQTAAAETGATTTGAFHRITVDYGLNARREPVLTLACGTVCSTLTLTGLTAMAAVEIGLRFSPRSADDIAFDDLAIRPVPPVWAPAPTASGSRLVRRLAAGQAQKVVVYGTSLTAGGPWVGQMQSWIAATYRGALTLVNSGLSGKNSQVGLDNLDAKVLAHNPDCVFIEFGVNDAFAGGPTLAQSRANLEALIDRIRAHDPQTEIILQTMNGAWDSPGGSGSSAAMRPNLADYYQLYRAVADARGLLLVDHYPNWRALQCNAPDTFHAHVPDGVHPVAAGTQAVTLPLLKARLIGDVRWVAPDAQSGPLTVDADVCVYGGTSAGVVAAVQAARMGRRVVVVEPGRHLGGLTAGGLGDTDVGNSGAIGGLAREFYRRAGQAYGKTESFLFEPHVAEQIFSNLLAEANVPVYAGRQLGGVTMDGAGLTSLATVNSNVFRARMFIDATYEGDLLAKAGVRYRVGREANAEYGETINGIRLGGSIYGIDPYDAPGNPASGLLPRVNADAGGAAGAADSRVQAYCYRMCLTDVPSNRVMVARPADYDEADYELLFRALEGGMPKESVFKLRLVVNTAGNRKTDSNNNGPVSTDFVGMSDRYAEAGYAEREQIARAHARYQQGLLWTVQNHPRIPQACRDFYAPWGLPLDEFRDNGHWPHQLYVREARRMVSEFVMTENHCRRALPVADPVGLGSYTMDSHGCQYAVGTDGTVHTEGGMYTPPGGPYPIGYRAIRPRAEDCTNLLVAVCVSSTHAAFGSIRMEPVFMILGQSAATAAALALDRGCAVQDVPYAELRARLLADGQVLGDAPATGGIVVDNADATGVTIVGTWTASTASAGYWGFGYLHDGNADKGAKRVTFTPTLPSNGLYQVQVRWTANANRATNVPVDIVRPGATNTVTVNQQAQGGQWITLLTGSFAAGTNASVRIRTDGTDGYVVADAVQFLPVANTTAAALLRYRFDEPGGPAADRGLAPPAAGAFAGDAARRAGGPPGRGRCLDLAAGANGAAHYVTAGDAAKLDGLEAFTLTTWLNLRGAAAANDRLLDKLQGTPVAAGWGWKIASYAGGQIGLALHVNSIGGQATTTATVAASNQWRFLALTYDGSKTASNVWFYAGATNAVATPLGTVRSLNAGAAADAASDLRVGSTAATTADRTPPAWFDDVRVYGAALDAAAIEAVRLEGLAADTADARLTMASGGSELGLAWDEGAAGAVLYASTQLVPRAEWLPVGAAPVQTDGMWRVSLPAPAEGSRFYRLGP